MKYLINWKICLSAIIGAICVIIFLFPLAHFESTEIFDMKLFYTTEQADDLIRSYSHSDRITYRWFTVTIDILFPLCYGLFYFTLLTLLGRKVYNSKLFEKIKYVALGGTIFDILENINIFLMLSLYPKSSGLYAYIGGIFTFLKWFNTGITYFLLLITLLLLIIKSFQKKN